MLTIDDIILSYKEGVEIILNNEPQMYGLKGEYDSGEMKAIAYLNNNINKKDLCCTIFHELIHARDFILNKPECEFYNPQRNAVQQQGLDLYEEFVENEAIETYNKQPELINFIEEIFILKKL